MQLEAANGQVEATGSKVQNLTAQLLTAQESLKQIEKEAALVSEHLLGTFLVSIEKSNVILIFVATPQTICVISHFRRLHDILA